MLGTDAKTMEIQTVNLLFSTLFLITQRCTYRKSVDEGNISGPNLKTNIGFLRGAERGGK